MDVWSLGVVLFAMLAGYLHFHAKEKTQLSEKILAGGCAAPGWGGCESSGRCTSLQAPTVGSACAVACLRLWTWAAQHY